jgi:propionyl-CoA synthetase
MESFWQANVANLLLSLFIKVLYPSSMTPYFTAELLEKYGAPGALVVDNYWSTEAGSPITSLGLGVGRPAKPKPGTAGFPLPGMDVRVVNDEGKELGRMIQGNIVLKTPLGPTAFRTCWKDETGFQKV